MIGTSYFDLSQIDFSGSMPHQSLPRLVWVRSSHVSYTTTLEQNQIGEAGKILNRPDLDGFVWEKWPEEEQGNRSR